MPWYGAVAVGAALWLIVAVVVGSLVGHAASLDTLRDVRRLARKATTRIEALDMPAAGADSRAQRSRS
jgi:hypothetical protein